MSPDSRYPNRQSFRYDGYDYSTASAYFVTICARERLPVFNQAVLHAIVVDVWQVLPRWFPTITLDDFVIMPNHIHLIVWLGQARVQARHGMGRPMVTSFMDHPPSASVAAPYEIPTCTTPRAEPTLGDVIGTWKSLITVTYLRWVRNHAPALRASIWQRNYYERIVRNDRELRAIRAYIRANPARWFHDPDNVNNIGGLSRPASMDDYWNDIRRYQTPR